MYVCVNITLHSSFPRSLFTERIHGEMGIYFQSWIHLKSWGLFFSPVIFPSIRAVKVPNPWISRLKTIIGVRKI